MGLIQDALNRVRNKREYMTMEERRVLQNAEMMKNLAEEVLSTKLVKERPSSQASNHSDMKGTTTTTSVTAETSKPAPRISMTSLQQAPMTPPPTSTTPPLSNPFLTDDHALENTSTPNSAMMPTSFSRDTRPPSYFGHGRGQYSDTSSTSSSRPSSMISRSGSIKRSQRHRNSFRGLDTLYSPPQPSSHHHHHHQSRKDYEEESNAAFERVCSLLNFLISDAASAVNKPAGSSGNGIGDGSTSVTEAVPSSLVGPLVLSDSEHSHGSDDSAIEEEEGETDETNLRDESDVVATAAIMEAAVVGRGGRSDAEGLAMADNDDQIAQEVMNAIGRRSESLSERNSFSSSRPSSRAARIGERSLRARSRAGKDHPNRLSSLFAEIQDAQLALEAEAAAKADGEDVGQRSDQDDNLPGGHSSGGSTFSMRFPGGEGIGRSSVFGNDILLQTPGGSFSSDDDDNSIDGGMDHHNNNEGFGCDGIANAEDLLDPAFASVELPVYPAAGRRWATRTNRSYSTTSASSMPLTKRRSKTGLQQQKRESRELMGSEHDDSNGPLDPFSTTQVSSPSLRRSSSVCSSSRSSIRRRASFPARRAGEEWQLQQQHQQELEQQLQVAELEQVIQRVDSELDRTVETIDALTRDLVAVATHQNWMQAKLQKSLQFQKQQLEQIERGQYTLPHHRHLDSLGSVTTDDLQQHGGGEDESGGEDISLLLDPTGTNSPMQDLSRSLKQVAISVGRIMASNAITIPVATHVLGGGGQHQNGRRRRTKTVAAATATDATVQDSQGSSSSLEEEDSSRMTTKGFSWSENLLGGKELTKVLRRIERSTNIGGRLGTKFAEGMEALGRYSSSAPLSPSKDNNKAGDDRSTEEEATEEFEGLDTTSPRATSFSKHQTHPDATAVMVPPPDFEDFVAQCRLLTRTLVLPFIQLTHHAMTSQDSALALQPLHHHTHHAEKTAMAANKTTELENSDKGKVHQRNESEILHSGLDKDQDETTATQHQWSPPTVRFKMGSSMPTWPAAFPGTGFSSDEQGVSGGYGHDEATAIPPDSMIKAKALVSTGLYLIHLLYWTVLFIVGTLVLDPYLSESSGRQVVRIVDQVRAAIGIDQGAQAQVMGEERQLEVQQHQTSMFQSSSSASSSPIPSRRKRLASPSSASLTSSNPPSPQIQSSSRKVTAERRAIPDVHEQEEKRQVEQQDISKAVAVSTSEEKSQDVIQETDIQPVKDTANNLEELALLDLGLEEWIELSQEQQAKAQAQVQALEDKAIQVAVHFESLRQRIHQHNQYQASRHSTPISSLPASRVSSRPNSMYFGTTTSTSSSLSTASTLVAAHGTSSTTVPSAAMFPHLVSLNSQDESELKKATSILSSPLVSTPPTLSRSSSFKGHQQYHQAKLDAALPVSPLSYHHHASKPPLPSSAMHRRSNSRRVSDLPPKVSTSASTLMSATLSSPPVTSPVVTNSLGVARNRRSAPTFV
ncbi:hypothetical protein BGW41_002834 [Actinomortierella wolfii]|nr:hypothetical protein BGW41_002834 [Actinomortierella wolfii]